MDQSVSGIGRHTFTMLDIANSIKHLIKSSADGFDYGDWRIGTADGLGSCEARLRDKAQFTIWSVPSGVIAEAIKSHYLKLGMGPANEDGVALDESAAVYLFREPRRFGGIRASEVAAPEPAPDPWEQTKEARITCRRGDVIRGTREGMRLCYRVVSGIAYEGITKPTSRVILNFLLPGDFFGFVRSRDERIVAMALTPKTEITAYSLDALEKLAERDTAAARKMRAIYDAALTRSDARIEVLGRATALERVTSFLLELQRRHDSAGKALVLRMSRYDIADYLALSAESVSRIFTELQKRGAIDLVGAHRLTILDDELLTALSTGLGNGSSGNGQKGALPPPAVLI